ncbi:glycosyltransferase family 4 protein [Methanosphaera cuniculi]|uniref:glycosyltransferase family 4 protein n=1 Tax=Methanosphaera cuniculi TaxID=1077256 RepID=UPI0026DCE355|nr:glycosyltransferase family 4 protein [Methanosphaera cuniculi]
MKIAFIYDTVYPWVTGGAERRIYEIAKRLILKGHDVHIYSLGFWMNDPEYKDQKQIIYDGITYHSVGSSMDLYTSDDKRSIREALYFARCLLSVDFSDFDIIDVQGFPYFSCYTTRLKRGNAKLIITLHEVWNNYWYEYMGKIGFIGKVVEKGIMYLTDNIICVSDNTYANMQEIKTPKNSTIIENGVNIEQIINIKKSSEEFDVIYAGRLIPEKHVDLLIDAISILKKDNSHIKCCIIGNGPMKDELIQKAENLNLEDNIEFKDFCTNQDDLYSYMKSSKVFILPSTREGFGIVIIEANACGIPTITIDAPMNAAKSLISNKNGLISEDNPEDLADKIQTILNDNIFKRDDCIEFAKDYDWNMITDKTEKFYQEILK